MVAGVTSDKRVSGDNKIDPTTFSVILHSLAAATKEMTTTLEYTAKSPFIALMRDHSCSVFDGVPRVLYQEDALPVHSVAGVRTLEAVVEAFGDNIHEGDLFLCNHPYYGGTHNGDLTVMYPVYYKGEHLFWTVTRAHQQNTGQPYMGLHPTNVWQEGILIPPVKIFDRGEERQDVINFYLENVRLPDWLRADLLAMIGSVRVGAKRLIELVERYGVEAIKAHLDELIHYADRRTAEEIRQIPDGVYEAEGWADSDGVGTFNSRVKATVTVDDDMVYIDYAGSDPQVEGEINSSQGNMEANGTMGVLTCIDPTIPRNAGCLKHIQVTAPKGTIANAEWPASTYACTVIIGDVLSEVVWKALAHAIPDMVPAGWGRWNISNPGIFGDDYRVESKPPWMYSPLAGGSGGGSTKGYDGWPLAQTACSMAQMKKESIEMVELMFPISVKKNEFISDSAGQGEWVGGYGVELQLQPVKGPMWVWVWSEGHFNPPHGALKGKPGFGGGGYRLDTKTGKRLFYLHRAGLQKIEVDQAWCTFSTGGGGFGSPLDRDPEQVRIGVKNGLISLRSARDDFGVVLDPEDYQLDHEATESLRNELRAKEEDVVYRPTTPSAASWYRGELKEGDEIMDEERPEYLREGLSIHLR